jgi:serine/threonine-protein kinase
VSTFDIATLVQGAMRERQRVRPPMGSIIDKLIEEALLEFTSLTDEERAEAAAKKDQSFVGGSAPITGQFVDPTNWAAEIAMGEVKHGDPIRASLPAEVFEAGNLSALEDDLPSSRSSQNLSALSPRTPGQPMTSSAPAPPSSQAPGLRLATPAPLSSSATPRKSSSAASSVIVVVLAAAAAVVVAWFAHIIPHH